MGGLHGGIDFGRAGLGHVGPGGAGGGVEAGEAGGAVVEGAVDIKLEAVHRRVPLWSYWKAGITSSMKRFRLARLRSKLWPLSIQSENSS